MLFNIKNIFKNFLSAGAKKNYSEEKKALLKFKEVTDNEKDGRVRLGLAFNSGKNPLQEKMDDVNYRMPRLKTAPAAKAGQSTPAAEKSQTAADQKTGKMAKYSAAGQEKGSHDSIVGKLHLSQAWQAPKIIKTNLVKGEITTFIDWKKNINNLVVIFGVSAGIVIAGYIGLVIMGLGIENKGRLLEGDIDILKVQIIKAQDELKEIDNFQENLKYSKILLDDHIYWTNFFTFFESNLLPETMIEGAFSGGSDGAYTFSLVTDDFESMTSQIALLKNRPEVSSIISDGGDRIVKTALNKETEREETSVSVAYKINIVFNSDLFKKPGN